MLRNITASYRNQIEKAIRRNDSVSVNHRVTELLASYFDVVFALNGVLHPGEKRLLELAPERCGKGPANMRTQVEKVLRAAPSAGEALIAAVNELIDGLDRLLLEEVGLDPEAVAVVGIRVVTVDDQLLRALLRSALTGDDVTPVADVVGRGPRTMTVEPVPAGVEDVAVDQPAVGGQRAVDRGQGLEILHVGRLSHTDDRNHADHQGC